MRLCMNCGCLALESESCPKCGDWQEEPEATAERLARSNATEEKAKILNLGYWGNG